MTGSWAGAMGHTQFMPSTYQRYAIDGDGDGRIDLWGSVEDALASGANYLEQLGWERGFIWGREVRLPADFSFDQSGLKTRKSLHSWAKLGLRKADGSRLPGSTLEASLLVPAGHAGPAFLVYHNFHVIMGWNRSEYYAIAVGHLADRIGGAGRLLQPPPADQEALSRDDIVQLQKNLAAAGYGSGTADGIFGPATRRALSQFQKSVGLIADGFPDPVTLEQLAATARLEPDG
jgi:membrane-bound lytic murein transglycosylase B